MKDLKTAEQLNEDVLKKNPKDAQAHLIKGRLYLTKNDPTNAFLEFNKTRQFEPDLAAVHFWIAQAYLQQNKVEQAKQALGVAINIDENYREARLLLADLQMR